jgi:hypothetical protein
LFGHIRIFVDDYDIYTSSFRPLSVIHCS